MPTHRLALIPDGVDFETAAALPMAGTTAANLVRGGGSLLGTRLLITGASGGVGHIAVQLAVLGGADVTAVASARGRTRWRLRRAGRGRRGDTEGPFDVILESAGGPALDAALARVAPGGTC